MISVVNKSGKGYETKVYHDGIDISHDIKAVKINIEAGKIIHMTFTVLPESLDISALCQNITMKKENGE